MFKKTTNIAVIVSGIDEEYQNNILKGIRQCALENSYNVSYFIAFGGVLQSYKHDHGEFNIFNLPNFSRFDGAILLTNTISSDSVREHVFSEIKKANIPVVSIDNDIPEMYYIGIDNKLAMKKIAEHLIIYHGFSDFKYISGPLNNTDSMKRLEGFLEAIEEHNIPFNKDDDVMVGDFTAKYGKAVAETIVNSKHIPQAIVCANDAMALGLLYALESRGVSCPEQVCISGFDNILQEITIPNLLPLNVLFIIRATLPAKSCSRTLTESLSPVRKLSLQELFSPQVAVAITNFRTILLNLNARISGLSKNIRQAYRL